MNKAAVAVLALVYVLSPIDLMPEILLGPLGLADDAVVGLMGLRALLKGK